MEQKFSPRQTTESKNMRSSLRMKQRDIWDPARLSVGPTLFVLFINDLPQIVESKIAISWTTEMYFLIE